MDEEPISKEAEKPKIDDPRELLNGFINSKRFKESFDKFYQRKNPKGTPEEMKIACLQHSDETKIAFLDYIEHDVSYRYDPEKFPPEVVEDINKYADFVKDFNNIVNSGSISGNQSQILENDRTRSRYHTKAATTMVKHGIIPTIRLGKALLSVIVGHTSQARVPDIQRLTNTYKL